jgi:hypothetical protein
LWLPEHWHSNFLVGLKHFQLARRLVEIEVLIGDEALERTRLTETLSMRFSPRDYCGMICGREPWRDSAQILATLSRAKSKRGDTI